MSKPILTTDDCHSLAEHVLRFPAENSAQRWLKAELSKFLVDTANVHDLQSDYEAELELTNPYLAEIAKSYEV